MDEPLWSNERISQYAGNSPTAMEARRMFDAMVRVRDEYEARLAALTQMSEWEPVQEYSYTEHLNMGPGKPSKWQNVEIRGRMITIDRDDTGMHAALLPQGMGVFRRPATPQPADDTRVCSECEGDGELEDNSHISPPVDGDWPMITCWKCNGTGIEPPPAPEAND